LISRTIFSHWVGIVDDHLIGPYILSGVDYLDFLRNRLEDLLEGVLLTARSDMWYLLDDAPPHYAIIVDWKKWTNAMAPSFTGFKSL
jgi:hypothetical protein